MTAPTIPALEFQTPLVNPAPFGLYAATAWTDLAADEPLRFLGEGVRFWPHNYGGEDATRTWDAPWCGPPTGQVKEGPRPAAEGPFGPITVFAYDECDLSAASREEVRTRATQNLRLLEPTIVEREFAARLLADAPAGPTGLGIVDAVAWIEAEFAKTNTVGFIHASAAVAAQAVPGNLAVRSGTGHRSPMGHLWVFGGGYVDGLGDALVSTSPTFGWRAEAVLRDALDPPHNLYAAVAERSVVIGYERAVASVVVTP